MTAALPAKAFLERRAVTFLEAVYRQADAAFAPFSCPASGECCQLTTTGRQPYLWKVEWLKLVRALEREQRAWPEARADGGCPFLDEAGKRCTVYADRPLGCRTFFCERIRGPSRQPVEAMDAMLRKIEQLALELDPEDQPLPLLTRFEAPRR